MLWTILECSLRLAWRTKGWRSSRRSFKVGEDEDEDEDEEEEEDAWESAVVDSVVHSDSFVEVCTYSIYVYY